MPGTKSCTKRWRKHKPPKRSISAAVNVATLSTPPLQPTASALQQKLCFLESSKELDSDSAEEMDVVCEGQGLRLLELEGLQSALEQAASSNISQAGLHTGFFLWGGGGGGHISAASRGSGGIASPENFLYSTLDSDLILGGGDLSWRGEIPVCSPPPPLNATLTGLLTLREDLCNR